MIILVYILALLELQIRSQEFYQIAKDVTSMLHNYQDLLSNQIQNLKSSLHMNSDGFKQMQNNIKSFGVIYVDDFDSHIDTQYEIQDQPLEMQIPLQMKLVRNLLDQPSNMTQMGKNKSSNQTSNQNKTLNQSLILFGSYNYQLPLYPQQCLNNGKPILINETQYYCDNQKLSFNDYVITMGVFNSTNNEGTCQISYQLKYACLCPKDYSGVQCADWNSIICDFDQSKAQECPQFDSFYYNSAIDGNPPCVLVDEKSIYYDINRVICYNLDQNSLNETVSNDQPYQIIWNNYTEGILKLQANVYLYYHRKYISSYFEAELYQNDPVRLNQTKQYFANHDEIDEKTVFTYTPITYFYDAGGILVSSYKFVIQPRTTFLNWRSISKSLQFDGQINLTDNEMSGNKEFILKYDFREIYNQSLQNYGRFETQVDLILNYFTEDQYIYRYLCSRNPKTAFFEDSTYREPPNVHTISRRLVLGLTILFISLIILFIYLIINFKRRMDKAKLEKLLEDHRNRILDQHENLG